MLILLQLGEKFEDEINVFTFPIQFGSKMASNLLMRGVMEVSLL